MIKIQSLTFKVYIIHESNFVYKINKCIFCFELKDHELNFIIIYQYGTLYNYYRLLI